MTIKAKYNGQTYEFPDGTPKDQIYSYLNQQTQEGAYHKPRTNTDFVTQDTQQYAPPQMPQSGRTDTTNPNVPQQQDTGLFQSQADGSLMNTIGAAFNRRFQNVVGAMADDPNTSRYQMKRAERANQEYATEASKLNTAGQLIAGAADIAPVMAASVIARNPLAGAAVMGGFTTADTLAQQLETEGDYDVGRAAEAGAGSAAIDLATAGLAGRGVNVARQLSRPTARVAGEVGAQAAQGSASNMASQVLMNTASGRPWDENLAEAGLTGGIAGGGIHGATMGFNKLRGVNEALDIPVNDSGQASARRQAEISRVGGRMPEDLRENAIDYDNMITGLNQTIQDLPYGRDSADLINQYVDTSLNNGSASAVSHAMKTMLDNNMPVNARALDIEMGNGLTSQGDVFNLAQKHGFDPTEVRRAGESLYQLDASRQKSIDAGLTPEAQQKKIQMSYKNGINQLNSPIKDAIAELETARSLERGDRTSYDLALKDLNTLNKYAADSVYPDRRPTPQEIRTTSISLMRNLHDTGMVNQLKGLDGVKGSFNPIQNLETIQKFHDMTTKMYNSVREGSPDELRAGAQYGKVTPIDMATDAALMAAGLPPIKSVIKKAGGALKSRRAEKVYQRNISEGEDIARSWSEMASRRPESAPVNNQAAQRGDFEGAAQEADADLASMGINTGEAQRQANLQQEAPVTAPEPVPAQPEPTVAPQPEVAPQAPTERPDLTGRSVREREAQAAAEREAAQATPEVDPEVAAAQRAALEAQLAQDARVAAQRRQEAARQPEPEPTPVEEAPTPQRGNLDAELTQDAARMQARREQQAARQEEPATDQSAPSSKDERRFEQLSSKRDIEGLTTAEQRELDGLSAKRKAPEEPKEEETTEATAPAKERAMLPLTRRVEKAEQTPRKEMSMAKRNKYLEDKKVRKEVEDAVSVYSRKNKDMSEEDVYEAIAEMGGVDKITANNQGTSTGLNTLMKEFQNKKAKEAEADAKRVNEISDEELGKIENEAKADTKTRIEDLLRSKNVPDDIIQEAYKRAENTIKGDIEPKHVINFAKTIADERAKTAAKEAQVAETPAKGTKPVSRTMQDTYNDLETHLKELGLDGDPKMKRLLNQETSVVGKRDKSPAMSEAGMRSFAKKVQKYIDEQHDAYEAALQRAHTQAPEREAEFRATRDKFRQYQKNIKGAEANLNKRIDDYKAAQAKKAEDAKKAQEAKKAKEKAEKVKKAVQEVADSPKSQVQIDGKELQRRIEDALRKEFSGKSGIEIQFITDKLVQKMPSHIKGTDDPKYIKFKATLDTAAKGLREADRGNQAKAVEAVGDALTKAMKRKDITGNRDLWLSTDERNAISDMLTNDIGTNTFYGRLYQKLRAAVFSDEQSTKHVRYPTEALEEMLADQVSKRKADVGDAGIDVADVKVK